MINDIVWILKYSLRHLYRNTVKNIRYNISNWAMFWKSYFEYKKLAPEGYQLSIEDIYPCVEDNTSETNIEPVYFYQDVWAFERIFKDSPRSHIDVGSHHKFVAFLSKVLPVTMVDIRPLSLKIDSLKFQKGSILDLPFPDNTVESLSSLCVVEHIGLGRYGDSLDPYGTEKAIKEIKRVLKPNGHLYISLPVGTKNVTYFNAHRVLSENYLEGLMQPLSIVEKAYICGNELVSSRQSEDCIGLYHLKK